MRVNSLIQFQKWLQSCIYHYYLTSSWNLNKTPLDMAIEYARVERLLGVPADNSSLVSPGKAVTLFDVQMNEEVTITLVSPNKSDPINAKISYLSLLGSRLLGCKIGDIVEINIFGRKEIFYVIDIQPCSSN